MTPERVATAVPPVAAAVAAQYVGTLGRRDDHGQDGARLGQPGCEVGGRRAAGIGRGGVEHDHARVVGPGWELLQGQVQRGRGAAVPRPDARWSARARCRRIRPPAGPRQPVGPCRRRARCGPQAARRARGSPSRSAPAAAAGPRRPRRRPPRPSRSGRTAGGRPALPAGAPPTVTVTEPGVSSSPGISTVSRLRPSHVPAGAALACGCAAPAVATVGPASKPSTRASSAAAARTRPESPRVDPRLAPRGVDSQDTRQALHLWIPALLRCGVDSQDTRQAAGSA